MRRFLASLLLVLISFSLVSPVLAATAKPDLPACCLRNGKHHCMMGATVSTIGGPGLRVDCPFQRHGSLAASSNPRSSLLAPSVVTPCIRHISRVEFLSTRQPDLRRITAHGQRGPPAYFE